MKAGWLAVPVLLASCIAVPEEHGSLAAPAQLDDGWKTASPEAAGLSSARLAAMVRAIETGQYTNVHSVLIERDGRLVFERYFAGEDERWGDPLGRVQFGPQTLHDMRSVGKSVTSALVGIAFADRPSDLDRSILEFFPEYAKQASPGSHAITPRHLLSMTAGWQWDESMPYWDPGNDERAFNHSADPLGYLFSRPLVAAPGTRWTYCGGATELLAQLVQRRTGTDFTSYARSALFAPLGVTEFEWVGRPGKGPAAASGLRLRPRDMLKFGSLYAHEGRWQGRQVIPAAWVSESLRRHADVPDFPPWDMGYGYQWWEGVSSADPGLGTVHAAFGKGRQRVFVVPTLGLVVAITAGTYESECNKCADELIDDWIYASARPDGS